MVVVVGGVDFPTTLLDVWLLDVTNKQWNQVSFVIKFSVFSSLFGMIIVWACI